MALKFSFKANVDEWRKMTLEKQRPVATAAVAALRDVAAISVQEGRQDIAAAGNFTGKWISGLQYRTKGATEGGEPSLDTKATIFHRYGIAGVFESGATIKGSPLLWIPFTRGAPDIKKSRKKLTFATVNGLPLAFDANDRDRHRKPLYFGKEEVTISKKFYIEEIVKKNYENFDELFYLHFESDT